MGTITEHKGKTRTTYRATSRHKGYPTVVSTFDRKTDAKRWLADVERAFEQDKIRKRSMPSFVPSHALSTKEVPTKVKRQKKKTDFYRSQAWLTLRYAALEASNGKCACCGKGGADGVVLHVDHIKPRSKYPELALSLDNLQILCEECNLGKGNKFDTNWLK